MSSTPVTAHKRAKPTGKPFWVPIVAKYQDPSMRISLWQMATSFLPYFILWGLMVASLQVSYWLTLLLSIPAAGFLMRIFIIQHDCGHTSFFKSNKLNDAVGFVCGVLTFTPYGYWRTGHAMHHASSGDLDRRGFGDVWTMTFAEYAAGTPSVRKQYRMYRNPFIMFGLGPLFVFIVNQRTFMAYRSAPTEKAKRSLIATDIAILLVVIVMSFLIGFKAYVLIQLPIALVAGSLAVWLFYVQHNFEDTYWAAHPEWDYTQAALQGSSYYKMPRLLQWFTGNIGLHHIHHLNPRIPNYLLEKCHDENPAFQNVPTLTVKTALKVVGSKLALWDESQLKLISFEEADKILAEREKPSQAQTTATPAPAAAAFIMPEPEA